MKNASKKIYLVSGIFSSIVTVGALVLGIMLLANPELFTPGSSLLGLGIYALIAGILDLLVILFSFVAWKFDHYDRTCLAVAILGTLCCGAGLILLIGSIVGIVADRKESAETRRAMKTRDEKMAEMRYAKRKADDERLIAEAEKGLAEGKYPNPEEVRAKLDAVKAEIDDDSRHEAVVALASVLGSKERSRMETLELEATQGKRGMGIKARRRIGNTASYIGLILISVVWITPFIFLIFQSLETASTGWSAHVIPHRWGFDNYLYLFSAEANFNRWYFNTYIIALVVCIGQTLMQLAMAYVLSRFRFKLRKPMMNFMLILGMFPGFLTMIILYNVLKDLGLTQANAVPGLILVSIASSGMGYYVIKGFFDTVSKSLDEAAMIDGATRAQVFFKIILPLAKPIVIYTILTAFMGPWGDYIFASYIAFGNPMGYNVAVGLFEWLSTEQISYHYTHFCSGGVVVSIPVITLFLMLQRYYVEGVTGGAVKG